MCKSVKQISSALPKVCDCFKGKWGGLRKAKIVEMNHSSTRALVADYINHRLRKREYVWNGCPQLENSSNTTCRIQTALRSLGDDFERRYCEEFDDMVDQLSITADMAYPTFMAVAQELFIDGINWGRVVALIAFGGAIAIECINKDMEHLVDSIHDWVSTYISNNLEQWILTHGGWVSRHIETHILMFTGGCAMYMDAFL